MNYIMKNKRLIRNHYSHAIILPRLWLQQHRLENGGCVNIELRDNGSLTIRPSKVKHVQNNAQKA